jgi:hypothetical protein
LTRSSERGTFETEGITEHGLDEAQPAEVLLIIRARARKAKINAANLAVFLGFDVGSLSKISVLAEELGGPYKIVDALGKVRPPSFAFCILDLALLYIIKFWIWMDSNK